MGDSRAKSNLRQALHDLNKQVGDYLNVAHQNVQISHEAPFEVDVLVLKAIINPSELTVQELQAIWSGYIQRLSKVIENE